MNPDGDGESWLHGYSVSGVAGIPTHQAVRIGPLARMNFLVGRNNHGKSTLMRAAAEWTGKRSSGAVGHRETLVPLTVTEVHQILRRANVNSAEERRARIAQHLVEIDDARVAVWAKRSAQSNTSAQFDGNGIMAELKEALGLRNYNLGPASTVSPHVAKQAVTIPAFRELRAASPSSPEGGPQASLASGAGLVAELSAWERPKNPGTQEYTRAKERWTRLRDFVREVLEDPDAELEVADHTDLHVRLAQAGSMLHINSLGDGIKQVVMMAAACIYYDDHLVLLEEPEIHLHAGLQRKLVRFLATATTSQYIIATHSAHMLDLPDARIFHVTHDGSSSKVTSAVEANEVHRVCQDLGYMASDLLQANYAVWVEGPSDRIYWRRWLHLVDPELEEGVHFTVMTYGGYLVDGLHLRDERDVENDLIELLRLGRNCTLIADSDMTAADEPVRSTLQRLAAEAEQPGSGDLIAFDWVSTVENLVPRALFREVVIELHPIAGPRLRTASAHSPFDAPFHGLGNSSYSKVRVARAVVPRLTLTDMDERLVHTAQQLAEKIRLANGL